MESACVLLFRSFSSDWQVHFPRSVPKKPVVDFSFVHFLWCVDTCDQTTHGTLLSIITVVKPR